MTIRERTQQIEEQILSPYASLSKNTLGRDREETECELRTAYQRDRDRIIPVSYTHLFLRPCLWRGAMVSCARFANLLQF